MLLRRADLLLELLSAKHIVIRLFGGVTHFHILSHDRDAPLYSRRIATVSDSA